MIYAYMITRNEAGRYLEETVSSLQEQVDGVCVYDDRSDDATTDILTKLRVPHLIRGPQTVSFLEDESLFREHAWKMMESVFNPHPGDWILTLDADEILRSSGPLTALCEQAERDGHDALWMHVHELYTPSQIRTDGYWGTIRALRFALWHPNGKFAPKAMGGGSLPDYIRNPGETTKADILHYGYIRPEDRQEKFDRYSKTVGHSRSHINSILTTAKVAKLPPLV